MTLCKSDVQTHKAFHPLYHKNNGTSVLTAGLLTAARIQKQSRNQQMNGYQENLVNTHDGILLSCGMCNEGAQKWTELETITFRQSKPDPESQTP